MQNTLINTLFSRILSSVDFLIAKNQGVILCLHSVKKQNKKSHFFERTHFENSTLGNSTLGRMAITDVFLECMILHFKRHNIPIISLDEALARASNPKPNPFISITFDDGYRDNFTDAYPVFLKHNVPFTVFLTTGLIDRTLPMWWDALEKIIDGEAQLKFENQILPNSKISEKAANYSTFSNLMRSSNQIQMLEYLKNLLNENKSDFTLESTYDQALSWDMIKNMQKAGIAHFGAHSISHRLFSSLNETELCTEITESRHRIEKQTGITPLYFAYPFGQQSEIGIHASKIIKKSGFKAAFTTTRKACNNQTVEDLYSIPRVMIGRGSQNIFKLWANLKYLTIFQK